MRSWSRAAAHSRATCYHVTTVTTCYIVHSTAAATSVMAVKFDPLSHSFPTYPSRVTFPCILAPFPRLLRLLRDFNCLLSKLKSFNTHPMTSQLNGLVKWVASGYGWFLSGCWRCEDLFRLFTRWSTALSTTLNCKFDRTQHAVVNKANFYPAYLVITYKLHVYGLLNTFKICLFSGLLRSGKTRSQRICKCLKKSENCAKKSGSFRKGQI